MKISFNILKYFIQVPTFCVYDSRPETLVYFESCYHVLDFKVSNIYEIYNTYILYDRFVNATRSHLDPLMKSILEATQIFLLVNLFQIKD